MLKGYLDLTHRRAVYTTLSEFLRRYLPNDLGPPKDVIPVSDGVFSAVQEHVIAQLVAEFEGTITALSGELQDYESTPAVPEEKPRKKLKKKSAAE